MHNVIDLPHYGKFKPETVKIGNVSMEFLPLLAGSNFIPATVKIGHVPPQSPKMKLTLLRVTPDDQA